MTGLVSEIGAIVGTAAVHHDEPPSMVRRRRIVVIVVLVIGATLLGFSLTRTPGDTSFYVLTFALAAVWAFGARLSGPLHLGCVTFRGRQRRPVITGAAIGVLLGAVFIVGGLVAREIPPVRDYIVEVLQYANYGALWLVVLITVINGVAEEMFFRGALYTALGRFHPEMSVDGRLRRRGVRRGQSRCSDSRASSSARCAPTNAESPVECSRPC